MTITTSRETHELYGFRDEASGTWLRFYTPGRRYDLWQEYVAGARRTYQRFKVEHALKLPEVSSNSVAPIFSVAIDDAGEVKAGWYTNGPLRSVSRAHAPSEFASEPLSAALVADWIAQVIPAGVMEMKGAWVDPDTEGKTPLADLLARSYLHALRVVGVEYAFGTAAEHAAPRWANSGAKSLPDIVAAAYPDERYRTTFLWWSRASSQCVDPAQRSLFAMERLRAAQYEGQAA